MTPSSNAWVITTQPGQTVVVCDARRDWREDSRSSQDSTSHGSGSSLSQSPLASRAGGNSGSALGWPGAVAFEADRTMGFDPDVVVPATSPPATVGRSRPAVRVPLLNGGGTETRVGDGTGVGVGGPAEADPVGGGGLLGAASRAAEGDDLGVDVLGDSAGSTGPSAGRVPPDAAALEALAGGGTGVDGAGTGGAGTGTVGPAAGSELVVGTTIGWRHLGQREATPALLSATLSRWPQWRQ